MVRAERLEPHDLGRWNLNPVRLPIPLRSRGSVANSLFTCLYWRARDDPLLQNQRLNAAVMTGNSAENRRYFEFATEPVIVRSYERVNSETPIKDLRWTIMHVFLPTESALKKMSDLGIMATAQDHAVLLGHNRRRWWGDKRAGYAIPIRAMLDAGVHVGGGTDGPVVPVDPFLSMWWMTTRGTLSGYQLGPEQAITPREALQLYTINNAIVMGVEKDRGSIESGKLADLAVLSRISSPCHHRRSATPRP